MIDAIVTAIGNESVVAIPTENAELDKLVGKKVSYVDNSNRAWKGQVTKVEEPGVEIVFDKFPTSIGQGQILQIED
ncbi:MAG: hypothetical protein ACP5T4_00740 [Candidatus Micrarchaeia archaeon]